MHILVIIVCLYHYISCSTPSSALLNAKLHHFLSDIFPKTYSFAQMFLGQLDQCHGLSPLVARPASAAASADAQDQGNGSAGHSRGLNEGPRKDGETWYKHESSRWVSWFVIMRTVGVMDGKLDTYIATARYR